MLEDALIQTQQLTIQTETGMQIMLTRVTCPLFPFTG
jgi:hypothetical protein